jgi:hypothetical protein
VVFGGERLREVVFAEVLAHEECVHAGKIASDQRVSILCPSNSNALRLAPKQEVPFHCALWAVLDFPSYLRWKV